MFSCLNAFILSRVRMGRMEADEHDDGGGGGGGEKGEKEETMTVRMERLPWI